MQSSFVENCVPVCVRVCVCVCARARTCVCVCVCVTMRHWLNHATEHLQAVCALGIQAMTVLRRCGAGLLGMCSRAGRGAGGLTISAAGLTQSAGGLLACAAGLIMEASFRCLRLLVACFRKKGCCDEVANGIGNHKLFASG